MPGLSTKLVVGLLALGSASLANETEQPSTNPLPPDKVYLRDRGHDVMTDWTEKQKMELFGPRKVR